MAIRQLSLTLLLGGGALAGLSCGGGDITAPTTGSLEITTATSGPAPDPDGYGVTIDTGTEVAIGDNASLRRDNLDPGNHSVRLSGMATNCAVAGENPRSVPVSAGATASVSFAITCAALPPTTGTLQVTTTTSGPAPDPDGYTLSVDHGAAQSIGVNASVTISNLSAGVHTVALAGIANNCRVVGDNPATVIVVAGAQATVTFALDCPRPSVTTWTPMAGGGNVQFADVWGTGANDVFAAGYEQDDPNDSSNRYAVVLHYDGAGWSQQLRVPAPFGFFASVWANSPTDAYVVGNLEGVFNKSGSIYHYDGTRWTLMPISPGIVANPQGNAVFSAVWGISATEIFVVGTYWATPKDLSPLIIRYDGNTWQSFPAPVTGIYGDLRGVWGISASDLYVVGAQDWPHSKPVVLHYNGTAWSTVHLTLDEGSAYSIWGSSGHDIFVSQSTTAKPPLIHYNGVTWSYMAAPATGVVSDLWGTSGADLFATAGRSVLHYDGTKWSSTDPLTSENLSAIWGNSPTDVFAVGANGTILHGTP